ncbi:MAG: DUF1203 domain-containing protein [Bacteroidota bacterium]
MRNFKIIPLSAETANEIRSTKKDFLGNDIVVQTANGAGPCRQSLQPFIPGKDKRILLSYSPFSKPGLFAETGPIFIYENEVASYRDIYRFPAAIKSDKINFPLSLIGYNSNDNMVYTKLVGDEDVEDLIEQIFDTRADIHYLHVRNSEACCFICKVDRRNN